MSDDEAVEVEAGTAVEEDVAHPETSSEAVPDREWVARRAGAALRIGADGALTRDRAELFALHLVELLNVVEAWKAAGGKTSGGSEVADRRALLADPVFLARLEGLLQERVNDLAQGAHGEAMSAARMALRMARRAGEPDKVLRAAELMARIADRIGGPAPEAGGSPEPAAARGPGRPAAEAKQTRVDMGRIRGDLERLGLEPEKVAAVEAA